MAHKILTADQHAVMGIAGNTLTLPPIRTHRLPPDATKAVFYKNGQPFMLDIPNGAESATVNGETGEVTFNMPNPDPWVVIGTTTIDGSIGHVGGLLRVLSNESSEDAIDAFLQSDDPWLVGRRWLRARRSHCDHHANTAIIRCDIVRRQSEIDAERFEQEQAIVNGLMRVHMNNLQCPECGPHGNRGRVLLMDREVACTVCAGGVSGDAFGVVEDDSLDPIIEALAGATGGLKTSGLAEIIREEYAAVMQCTGIPRDILFGHEPTGFEVPTKATIDNYMDWLCSNQCGIE